MKSLFSFVFALTLTISSAAVFADTTSSTSTAPAATSTTTTTDTKATDTKTSTETKTDAAAKPASKHPVVLIETSKGNIKVELDAEKAPNTVENFLGYVKDGFYEGTIFHRVIPKFMIQGGGMLPDMTEKPTKPSIKNEAKNGLKNDRGTIAMARTPDPDSAAAQFFINVADNDFLNHSAETLQGWGYAVFGKVLEGMDVADAIVGVKTENDQPVEAITIKKISVVE